MSQFPGCITNRQRTWKGFAMVGIILGFFIVCWVPMVLLLTIVSVAEVLGKDNYSFYSKWQFHKFDQFYRN